MSERDGESGAGEDASSGSDSDQDFAFLVESRLTGFGCYLTDFEETDDGYELTYESIAADEASAIQRDWEESRAGERGAERPVSSAIPHREVGRIVNVFRDIEDDPVGIEGTVTDLDGEPLGEWRAERDWLVALEDGEMDELEFSERVVESIEPVEE